MAAQTSIYSNAVLQLLQAKINLATDTLKFALLASNYVPKLDSDTLYGGTTSTSIVQTLGAPAAPVPTQASGGSLSARTEYYILTYVNAYGETTGSTEVNISALANNVVTVPSPPASGNATGYNVYGATSSGAEKLQNGTPIAIGTNWTEPTSGLTNTGAVVPAANTTNPEVTGTGYAAGGVTVSGQAVSQVAASGFTSWVASTVYYLGQYVSPATPNGFFYLCVATGTSGSSAPTWLTVPGETTTDGGVVWLNVGTTGVKFAMNTPQWAASTITARYGVLYDTTANASGLLIAVSDFGSNFSSTASTFTVPVDANNGFLDFSRP